jgi:hypothetical protein
VSSITGPIPTTPATPVAEARPLPGRLARWLPRGRRARTIRLTLGVLGVVWAVYVLTRPWGILGYDAFAYWAVDPSDLYRLSSQQVEAGAWRYSPVAAQVIDPLGLLSWPVFLVLWIALMLGALTWVAGPWAPALLLLPPVTTELYFGNIDLFLGLAIVVGFRWPAAWALILLTKPTAGIALLWFVARGEWRSFAIAVGAAALIAAPSLVLTTPLWVNWIREMTTVASGLGNSGSIAVRLVLAGVLALVAGRRNIPELVPVAVLVALPYPDLKTASVLVAVVPLLGRRLARVRPQLRPEPAS